MTQADHLAFFADADSPLAHLRTEPECPGQADSSGVVFPAADIETERRLALKLVRGRVAQDPDVISAAHADALAQSGIEHPRIAVLRESGHMPAGFYLLMDWLPGRPLSAVLGDGAINPWSALKIANDVADALEAARVHGVVHRDLTPSKIIVDDDGHARLGDLGAGRRRSGEPLSVASLDYVSPERVREEPLGAASHEYALACILFQCLTGAPPFARARASAKTFWHVRAPRPLVSERRAGLPTELDDVLVRGMAIDPAERHGSPEALVDAVGAALGPRPGDADSLRLLPVEPRHPPRPAIAAGAGAFDSWGAGQRATATAAPARARDEAATTAPAAAGATAIAATGTAGPGARTSEPAAGQLNWMQDATGPSRRTVALSAGAAVLAGLAVLAAGLLAGRGTKDPPPTAEAGAVGTSQVALIRPAGWRVVDPPPFVPGLAGRDEVAVAPPGGGAGVIVAGVAAPGRDGLLPNALLDRLPNGPGRAEPVRLGELEGFRYRDLQPRGTAPMTLYAVPTDDGTATVACLTGPGVTEATCDQQAATLQLTGPEPVPVRPAKDYAAVVARTFRDLNRSRTAAMTDLRSATTRSGQSRAAGRLSEAYGGAAGKLRRARSGQLARAANTAIVAAFEASARAYASMSYNAGRGDETGYEDARSRAIAAERQVEQALRRLEDAGYRVR